MVEKTNWEETAKVYVEKNFSYDHLTKDKQEPSSWHHELALRYLAHLPPNRMRQVALDYLLLAKDAAVRATIEGQP